jgi:hypothetical protein
VQFFGQLSQLANSLLDFEQSESGQTDLSECLAKWQSVECVSSDRLYDYVSGAIGISQRT